MFDIGLKWNNLSGLSGVALAKSIAEYRPLRVFDLSWNKVGVRPFDTRDPKEPSVRKFIQSMQPGELGKLWGDSLEANTTLVHLDLSFCQFDQEESKALGASLANNHTLVGFHF